LIAWLAPAEPGTTIRCDDGGPLAGRLAYMAQQDLLLPWLDVHGNVTLGHRLRGDALGSADRDRAATLLDQVGLAAQAGALPATLSGGMRQRAALARTLMEDRPVVLMDEPFSAVDAITRLALQDLAAALLAHRTVLLVTHDPLEALRLADRIYVMAGLPARLEAVAVPAGPPPRDVGDAGVLALQGELLHRLAAARAAVPNGVPA
jgi:putative hydroxymethylpyrimidine transport system ATP-binding protein